MTKPELLAAIDRVKTRMSRKAWVKREAYDQATGCIMPDAFYEYISIPYADLVPVTAKGMKVAQSLGLSFFCRLKGEVPRNIKWVKLSDNPDMPQPKRLPHIITRVFDWELLMKIRQIRKDIGFAKPQEEEDDNGFEDPQNLVSSEDYADMWEYSMNMDNPSMDEDDNHVFEALFGVSGTIEDPTTGETRLLRIGDEYQIYVSPRHNEGIDELDDLYGEETKDPRFDRSEWDWARFQSSTYGKYTPEEPNNFRPKYRPILCLTREENTKRKRAACFVHLFSWPSQEVLPDEEGFIAARFIQDRDDCVMARYNAVIRKGKEHTRAQAAHHCAMEKIPDNKPTARKHWPKIPRAKKVRSYYVTVPGVGHVEVTEKLRNVRSIAELNEELKR